MSAPDRWFQMPDSVGGDVMRVRGSWPDKTRAYQVETAQTFEDTIELVPVARLRELAAKWKAEAEVEIDGPNSDYWYAIREGAKELEELLDELRDGPPPPPLPEQAVAEAVQDWVGTRLEGLK